ncbi:MAG: hypothetical protein F6K42_29625 [Leptolyngbya sp. SIO1D8]|nr:hypothetical protein [Leptolyngbya sp. SIO1D8]
MHIERSTPPLSTFPTTEIAYTRVQTLVEQASSDGRLSRDEDDVILAAIVSSQSPTAEMCGLFRSLQERVWDGELILDT